MRVLSAFILSLSLVLQVGCGFQLRGADGKLSNMPPTYIAGSQFDPLLRDLRVELASGGVQVVSSAAEAGALLRVTENKFTRRILSVGPDDRAREYELVYKVSFGLLDREGAALVKTQSVSLLRDYFNDETQVLGRANEERFLREDLRKEMAQAIVRRLRANLG